MQIELKHVKNIFTNINEYVLALLLCKQTKNCSSMAHELNQTPYNLYKHQKTLSENEMRDKLINLIKIFSTSKNKGHLVLDDTLMKKPHMSKSVNLTYGRDGVTKRCEKGFILVTLSWTNGIVTLNFTFEYTHS